MKSKIFDIDAIDSLAKDLLVEFDGLKNKIIGLSGPLGAGKTTLIQALTKLLGCGQFRVTSPTFTIMHEYNCQDGQITHIDLYRLTSQDAETISMLKEQINQSKYSFIEWPEIIPEINKLIEVNIELEHIDDKQRRISIHYS